MELKRWQRRPWIFAISSFPTAPLARAKSRRSSQAIAEDYQQFGMLRDAVAELEAREDRSPAAAVRLGVCYYLLGRYRQAIETLQLGRRRRAGPLLPGQDASSPWATIAEAIKSLRGRQDGRLQRRRLRAGQGRSAALQQATRRRRWKRSTSCPARSSRRPNTCISAAPTVAALGGNPTEVVALFERAVEADRKHAGALFGLAMENDRRGNDETALDLYERAAAHVSRPTSARC